MKFLSLTFALLIFSNSAFSFDLKGKGKSGILVENHKDSARYVFCYDVGDENTCRILGPRQWYKKSDLESLQSKYYWKTVGNGAGALGAGIGSIFLGLLTAAGGTVITAGGTVAAGAGAVSFGVDFLDTRELATTALCEDAINDIDQNLDLNDKQMTKLALRLERALLSI